MQFMVIPKRKMHLPGLRDGIQQRLPPILPPTMIVVPPLVLSGLMIDTVKDWAGFAISNLGAPADNTGAARKADLDTAVVFIIDGGGSAITTGEKGHLRLPFTGTILSVAVLADQVGNIVVDIWKDTIANHLPTDADSITASAPPTLSSESASLDTTLTGWTKTFAAGDVLAFNVDSVTTVQRVTLSLVVRRT